MLIIDPLKNKIKELLKNGSTTPLVDAQNGYPTKDDIDDIYTELLSIKISSPDFRKYVYIDLTPYDRLVNIKKFIDKINEIDEPRPILLLNSQKFIDEILESYSNFSPVVIVKINRETGIVEGTVGGSEIDKINIAYIIKDFESESEDFLNYHEFRRREREIRLMNILYKTLSVDFPSPLNSDYKMAQISGRNYQEMVNKMLVSCYLNLKKIGRNQEALIDLAYEIVLEIMGDFCYKQGTSPLDDFDVLITTNNTSLLLATPVQEILSVPIIPIDKLGPIPSFQSNWRELFELLSNKRIVMIEEVIATGGEIDRAIIFLDSFKTEITKIIGLYNLDIAKPLLYKSSKVVSLCHPKKDLNYVYRSN